MNPLVNPGAISATSMVTESTSDACGRRSAGSTTPPPDENYGAAGVYKSESDTNQRNQAIGALMLAYGYIKATGSRRSTSTRASVRSA